MGSRFRSGIGPVLAGWVLLASCGSALGQAQADEPLQPLPSDLKFDRKKVALGNKLFSDKRLSKDGSTACISCHSFQHGGADPRAVSIGAHGGQGATNAPSVFNSGFNFRQQWGGAALSIEEQVNKVVRNSVEFDTSWPEILAKLNKDSVLVQEFKDNYPGGLTEKNAVDAIAVFTRSLVTPSRFDKYLLGDMAAITPEEKNGYDKFKKYGCVACHQGVNVGGNMFQKFGAIGDYFKARVAKGQPLTPADRGYYNVTKQEDDMHVFKVPSLRNVAQTAPYFHDASAKTLEEAVDVMFKYQLGRTAPTEDKALIVKFLRTLSGTLKEEK